MKKLTALALTLMLILGIGSTALAAEQPYIILVNALIGHPVYEQQAEAARKAAEEYGVNLEIIGPTFGTNTIVTDYLNAMETAMQMAPDAIICEPFDPSLFDVFHRAAQAGYPLFLTSNLLENQDDFVAWIGTDNYNYGLSAADMIAEKTGGKANICVVMGELATTNQAEQRQGILDRIEEKYPDMKVLNTVADKNDLSIAMTEAENTLNAYPDVNVFVMLESTGGPGVAQTCSEMGRDDVLILDIDAVEATIDNIKSGKVWATLAQNFYKRGYESIRMAYEYLNEGENTTFAKMNDSGTVLIDESNADSYEEDLWGAIVYKGTDWPAK